MFGFFRKKISSNQVDLYVSDKILGVAKKVVAIVEANGVTIVDGEGVVFLAAGLFLNATYLKEHGRKSEAVRVKVIGFVKHYLDSTDDKNMLERLWIGPYISRHFLSLNPLLVRRRRYSRGERYPSALCGCHSL